MRILEHVIVNLESFKIISILVDVCVTNIRDICVKFTCNTKTNQIFSKNFQKQYCQKIKWRGLLARVASSTAALNKLINCSYKLINCSYNPHKAKIGNHLAALNSFLDVNSTKYEKILILRILM